MDYGPAHKRTKIRDTLTFKAGVPQGYPTSPQLFSVFMDEFLRATNTKPERALTSLFVDDVFGLPKTSADMQHLLIEAQNWATTCDMVWNTAKSCGLLLPSRPRINGETLQNRDRATYLGVTITSRRISHTKLLERINAARGMLFKVLWPKSEWRTSTRLRRMMVKTFVLPIVDYVLHMQPLSEEVNKHTNDLETRCLTFILRRSIRPNLRARGTSIARLLSAKA